MEAQVLPEGLAGEFIVLPVAVGHVEHGDHLRSLDAEGFEPEVAGRTAGGELDVPAARHTLKTKR